MALQPPPPPSITPSQMTMLRIAATMAWSDGNLADAEVEVMLNNFSSLLQGSETEQQALRAELQDYMMQNIPLEELVPKLSSAAEKELVLRLGYAVIHSSARTPDEGLINPEEAAAYQTLLALLQLPPSQVETIEAEVEAQHGNLVDTLTEGLRQFITPD